jgi:hypothetical protein
LRRVHPITESRRMVTVPARFDNKDHTASSAAHSRVNAAHDKEIEISKARRRRSRRAENPNVFDKGVTWLPDKTHLFSC